MDLDGSGVANGDAVNAVNVCCDSMESGLRLMLEASEALPDFALAMFVSWKSADGGRGDPQALRKESLQGLAYPYSIGECRSRLSIGRVGLRDLPRDRALPRKVVA